MYYAVSYTLNDMIFFITCILSYVCIDIHIYTYTYINIHVYLSIHIYILIV